MRRTGFIRRTMPFPPTGRQWEGDSLPTPRGVRAYARIELPMRRPPIEKENALQHQGYMALVRTLPCARCGFYRKGFIQFCHADEGKGTGIKTDCRLGWPGCAPHDSIMGCHWYVGTSGEMPKFHRREFERRVGAETRAKIAAMGKWPKRLPLWTP